MKAANLVRFRQLKAKFFGVVVDGLNAIELQGDEALVTTGKSSFSGLAAIPSLCFIRCFVYVIFDVRCTASPVIIVVSSACEECGNAGIKHSV